MSSALAVTYLHQRSSFVNREVGFSDHRLLRWVSPFQRPPPVYTTEHRRSWRCFALDTFVADLQTSALCDERQYEHLDERLCIPHRTLWRYTNVVLLLLLLLYDALAKLYDDTITARLDSQVPVRKVTCCRRPSNMWFDDECRRAKLRSMERAACRAVRRQFTGRCGVARPQTSVLDTATA